MALGGIVLAVAAASAAHAHEPLNVRVEVTKFEEYIFDTISGEQGTVYKIGLALTNNGNALDTVSVWPSNKFGFPMAEAPFGIPGADCPPTSSRTQTSLPLGKRIAVEICFVRDSNAEPHYVKVVSTGGGGVLFSVIADTANEDVCGMHIHSTHSHCVPAEFTGSGAADNTSIMFMGAIGAVVAGTTILLARRRR